MIQFFTEKNDRIFSNTIKTFFPTFQVIVLRLQAKLLPNLRTLQPQLLLLLQPPNRLLRPEQLPWKRLP